LEIEEIFKYSQNFLKNSEFVLSLLNKTDISSGDIVVEIGAGTGVITQQLVNRTQKVIAIEYDKKLANKLQQSLSKYSNVEIIEANFLTWELPDYPYKVFSNIPFNITADIVSKLLESKNAPESTYLIMQDKAAERFIGTPIGDNSQTSILLKPFYDMGLVTRISRNQFEPSPKVNTVLAKFVKKEHSLIKSENRQEYRDFVIYGYNQWKPTILKAFDNVFSYKQNKIIKRNFGVGGMKPTELNIQQWIELFQTYMQYVPQQKKEKIKGSEKKLAKKQTKLKKQHRTRNRV
jgi:23S rRNA (adenine-N6)-dimethyltransferase